MIRAVLLAAAGAAALAGAPSASAAPRAGDATAQQFAVALALDPAGPAEPRMGDRPTFHATVANSGSAEASALVVRLTLLRLDAEHGQTAGLEDRSADKAQSLARLMLAGVSGRDWTLRSISPGTYRVLVSAVTRGVPVPAVAMGEAFAVAPRPVVESARVLPVAFGVPSALGGRLAWRLARSRRTGREER